MSLHIFGIRHHGPGSARSLRNALELLRPDAVLVEGPPDAAEALPLMTNEQMRPPVALLIYAADDPKRAVFYPFAVFSPEWQALDYALTNRVEVRFMDLPQAHQLAFGEQEDSAIRNSQSAIQADPIGQLAAAAGYSDGERWWEQMFEQRRDGIDHFAAVTEAMKTLRESLRQLDELASELDDEAVAKLMGDPRNVQRERLREAFMRQTIRLAQREGFERIALVCGAWHAPALNVNDKAAPLAKEDAALLKGLPKVKVQATWTPWTYGRLSFHSGYGAGIESPGWYDHLWTTPDQTAICWMARVARLMREEDLDVSSAHVIEAVRLAETLAALRGRAFAGLEEMNEAVQTVFCFGNDLPLRLVHERLIVGEVLGEVPEETPLAPLQRDLQREQKRLRLAAEALERSLDLDLRKPNDLDRSRLLHRLNLLGVGWGETQHAGGYKGTFHELWRLRLQPEFVVALIEAGMWGNTIVEAASARARDEADRAKDLPALTGLLDRTLLADLPEAVSHLMARLQAEAALATDVGHLMEALPPLASVMRYGNVRQTDAAMVGGIIDGLVARICIGLPGACASLNDEAAAAMFDRIVSVNGSIGLLKSEELLRSWQTTLAQLAGQHGLHGLVAGRCCRLLLDGGAFPTEEAARRLSYALSTASEPAQAAGWAEGFLKGSGLLLLHDERLWQVIDDWVSALQGESFTILLPLLRRTFSTFTAPERRQMGERAKRSASNTKQIVQPDAEEFDQNRAEAVLPLVARLLGIRAA